jgi:hypothetical protein
MCLQRIAATPSTAQPRDQRAGKPGLTKLAVYYLPRSLGSQLLSALPPPILGACASPILGRGATRGHASQGQRRRQSELRADFRPLRKKLPFQLLRRFFAFCRRRSRSPPPPPPGGLAGTADRSPARNRDSNQKPALGPQPFCGETWPRTGRTPGPTPQWLLIKDLVFGALTEVAAGGSSPPIGWLVGWGQPPGGAREAPRGR